MQSSTCQHVATLQFVSSAETDSASSKRRTASSVSDQADLSSVATYGDFTHMDMNMVNSHLRFSVVAKATQKIPPRPAKWLF